MTVMRRIRALVALCVVIVGLPIGLAVAGAPLMPSGLSWAHLRHLLTTPDMTGSVLVWLVSLIGWICWAWFTLAVAAEAVTMASGRRLRLHMPGPRVVPRVAAGLLIAAFAAAPAATSIAHAAEAPHVAVTAQVAPAHAATTHNSHGPHTPGAPKIWKTHTVRPGDYLWEIAEHYYGDGSHFRRIAEASGIDPHSELKAGQKLVLPVPENTAAVHSVQAGEYLWEIAEHYYGDGSQFHKIAEASGIDAHSDLAVGQKLIIPGPLHHATAPTSTHPKVHTPNAAVVPASATAPVHKATPAPAPTSSIPAHPKAPAVSSAGHSTSDKHPPPAQPPSPLLVTRRPCPRFRWG